MQSLSCSMWPLTFRFMTMYIFARLDIQDDACSASVLRKRSNTNRHLLVYITEYRVQLLQSEHTTKVLLSFAVNH